MALNGRSEPLFGSEWRQADDGDYGAWSPDLPGCVALGDTEQDALSEMKEAMRIASR